jgi:hypothetical protein
MPFIVPRGREVYQHKSLVINALRGGLNQKTRASGTEVDQENQVPLVNTFSINALQLKWIKVDQEQASDSTSHKRPALGWAEYQDTRGFYCTFSLLFLKNK